MYSDDKTLITAILDHIEKGIQMLREWNADVQSEEDYYRSPSGMEHLSASCMILEAIGEGVRQIEKHAGEEFFSVCPNIPWADIKGLRNHIAHGYFDIDGAAILDTVRNDLNDLESAIAILKNHLKDY